MIRRCAWCGLTLGNKPPLDDDRVTHGICSDCRSAVFGDAAEVAVVGPRPDDGPERVAGGSTDARARHRG